MILLQLFCRKEHKQLKSLSCPGWWDRHGYHQNRTTDHPHATSGKGIKLRNSHWAPCARQSFIFDQERKKKTFNSHWVNQTYTCVHMLFIWTFMYILTQNKYVYHGSACIRMCAYFLKKKCTVAYFFNRRIYLKRKKKKINHLHEQTQCNDHLPCFRSDC